MENNNLDKTYGFNNSKEKIEVYTKGDFAVITTQVVADEDSNRRGSTKVRLPKGFYSSNTIILGVIYSFNDNFFPGNFPYNFYNNGGSYETPELLVQLGDVFSLEEDASEFINITLNSTSITSGPQTVYVRLVLMKMSDVIEDVRPLKTGDDLRNNKVLYYNMKVVSLEDTLNQRTVVEFDNGGRIYEMKNAAETGAQLRLIDGSGTDYPFASKGSYQDSYNFIEGKIDLTTLFNEENLGKVTSVNTESPYYQYIRIKETND